MKIKADHNEFEDIDDIAFDLIMTIGTWQPDKLKRALEFLSCYINDFYYDYELTDEEFKEVEEIVYESYEDFIEENKINIR